MPIPRQETGLNLSRLADGQVDPIGRPGLSLYKGTCHCGRNRFEVHLRESQITNALACNCSLCHKSGYLWAFPGPGDINYTKGGVDTLGGYETEVLRHEFCTSCGTGLYGTHTAGPLEGQHGVNIRTILAINPFQIKADRADTAAAVHETPVKFPAALTEKQPNLSAGSPPGSESDMKTYTGSCQCGAVSFSVTTPPLSQIEVKEDNCSICVRRAATTIYPDKNQVLFYPPGLLSNKNNTEKEKAEEQEGSPTVTPPTPITTTYAFGRKFNQFPFCKTCGVACFGVPLGPPREVVSKLPAEKQALVESLRRMRPLYVRAMDGVEWDEINVVRSDEGTEGYSVRGGEKMIHSLSPEGPSSA